jgi:hypothetical protein
VSIGETLEGPSPEPDWQLWKSMVQLFCKLTNQNMDRFKRSCIMYADDVSLRVVLQRLEKHVALTVSKPSMYRALVPRDAFLFCIEPNTLTLMSGVCMPKLDRGARKH